MSASKKNINLDNIIPLQNVFEVNSIPIAFSSSDFFVPYLAVTIQSLMENSSENNNYDLVVFTKDMSDNNINILSEMVNTHRNFHIRFVNVKDVFNDLNLYTPGHISIETYFRLVIPVFMRNYKKILFLDSDLCILHDVAELYNIEIGDCAVAATEECLMSALVGIHGEWVKEYMYDKLGLSDVDKYFQAGIMIMNIEKFVQCDYSNKLLSMVMEYNYNIVDQDAMNELLNGEVYWLPNEWNYPPLQKHMKELNYIENMSEVIRNKYLSVKEPKILHFADKAKPWFFPDEDYANVWWSYAKTSVYYELIIKNMIDEAIRLNNENVTTRISAIKHYKENVLNYWRVKFFSKITSGKTKKHYIEKRKKYKNLIRVAKDA